MPISHPSIWAGTLKISGVLWKEDTAVRFHCYIGNGGLKMQEALQKLVLNIANLFKVKTVITIMVLGALTTAFLKGAVPVELYASIATAIITYYFTRSEKGDEAEGAEYHNKIK